jgi:hypothetical protein
MLRISMVSTEEAPEGWQAQLSSQGIQLDERATGFGSTVYYATMGDSNLLLEQASGREIATCLAYPTEGQQKLANALIQSGAARLDCCHLGRQLASHRRDLLAV